VNNSIILFLFLPVFLFGAAEDSVPDSLKTKFGQSEVPGKIQIYLKLAKDQYYTDPEKTILFSESALKLAKESRDKPAQVEAFIHLGVGYSLLSNNEKAIESHLQGLHLAEQIHDSALLATLHNELGIDYRFIGDFDKSVQHLLLALAIKEQRLGTGPTIQDRKSIANTMNNIGVVYDEAGNFDLALEYYRKVMAIREEISDSSGLASTLNNIGVVFEEKGEYEKALDYYEQALQLKKRVGREGSLALTLTNIGIIYLNQKNYPKALAYHFDAIEIFREIADSMSLANTCNSIADIYLEMKRPAKAGPFIREGLTISKEINARAILKDSYRFLAKYYAALHDFDKAYKTQQLLIALKDSLYGLEMAEELAEMHTRYQVDKKEQEIGLLTKDNEIQSLKIRKQSVQLYSLIAFTALIILLGFLLFNRFKLKQKHYRVELEKKNLENEQRLLRSQMNPHFIFNSLSSIQSYISGNDSFTAMTYLSKFARLMRFILENSRKSFISLADELSTLELYMELEQIRFRNKFDFRIEVADDISKDNTWIPPMLLQPVVENAIKNALRNKDAKGLLELTFTRSNGMLHCTVKDNGIGRAKATVLNATKTPGHISLGMTLTRERLEAFSREAHREAGMQIEDLEDEWGSALGTRVKVAVPLEEES